MTAIQIARCSAAGTSAIAAALAAAGRVAFDADNDPELARFVDDCGVVVTDVPP